MLFSWTNMHFAYIYVIRITNYPLLFQIFSLDNNKIWYIMVSHLIHRTFAKLSQSYKMEYTKLNIQAIRRSFDKERIILKAYFINVIESTLNRSKAVYTKAWISLLPKSINFYLLWLNMLMNTLISMQKVLD